MSGSKCCAHHFDCSVSSFTAEPTPLARFFSTNVALPCYLGAFRVLSGFRIESATVRFAVRRVSLVDNVASIYVL